MTITETDVSEGSEGDKRGTKTNTRSLLKRRLKRAVFLSAVFMTLGVSVFALSLRQESGYPDSLAAVPERKSDICPVLIGRDFWRTFGAEETIAENISNERNHCKEAIAESGLSVNGDQSGLEDEIHSLINGYPLDDMTPFIAEYNREVAALIVGIAKKESDWGKHSPSLAGRDCKNYWGLKGLGSRGASMGYACFDSPEEAARAVGDRIAKLVDTKHTSNPENLVVWKCGSSCAGHSPESVRSWIAGVRMYYDRIVKG
ncbi:MAG: hypothetical protein WCL23_01025 [Candidatus Moraniibacteriota bacterium]